MKTNDQEGTIMLSKRRYDAIAGWDKIVAAKENDEILTGTVNEFSDEKIDMTIKSAFDELPLEMKINYDAKTLKYNVSMETEIDQRPVEDFISEGEDRPGEGIHF